MTRVGNGVQRGYSAVVRFPELPVPYRRLKTGRFEAVSLRRAVTTAALAAFEVVERQEAKPKRVILHVEAH